MSQEHWSRSDNMPKDGELRTIKVRRPFAEKTGNEFHAEFMKALAFLMVMMMPDKSMIPPW